MFIFMRCLNLFLQVSLHKQAFPYKQNEIRLHEGAFFALGPCEKWGNSNSGHAKSEARAKRWKKQMGVGKGGIQCFAVGNLIVQLD